MAGESDLAKRVEKLEKKVDLFGKSTTEFWKEYNRTNDALQAAVSGLQDRVKELESRLKK